MHKKEQYKLVTLVRTTVHIAQLILFFLPVYKYIVKMLESLASFRS